MYSQHRDFREIFLPMFTYIHLFFPNQLTLSKEKNNTFIFCTLVIFQNIGPLICIKVYILLLCHRSMCIIFFISQIKILRLAKLYDLPTLTVWINSRKKIRTQGISIHVYKSVHPKSLFKKLLRQWLLKANLKCDFFQWYFFLFKY